MSIRVNKRYNSDGSITKRTTITRKTLLGTTKSRTYVERTSAKKKGCYIATAVYGSYDCPEVWTLRRFRDDYLDKRTWGKVFIQLYYEISPIVVKLFGNKHWFNRLWKRKLDNMVSSLNSTGYESTPYNDK